jgi:hypothetical protein
MSIFWRYFETGSDETNNTQISYGDVPSEEME